MTKPKIHKIVYFVRHGESEHNILPVFQSPDSPLSEKGKNQAELIAKRVSNLSFDTLISSTFLRAKETAATISRITGKVPELSELFIERVKPTSVNGKSYEDENVNKVWRQWEESLYTPGMRVEDAENFEDLIARADKALEFLKNRQESALVVVTHGYFLRTIIARVLLGESLGNEQFRNFMINSVTENTGLTVLNYQDTFEGKSRWRLWIYNDHAHLAE